VEDKNAWNSVPYHFAEEKKHSEFWSEPLSERKNFETLFQTIQGQRKPRSDFKKKTFFRGIPFCFKTGIGLFRDTQNSAKKAFARRITKSVPSLFCGIYLVRSFDSNPREDNCVLWGEGVDIYLLNHNKVFKAKRR
jgi:hypothetical protein